MPLAGHRRIALDSNVLIYLLEGDAGLADAAATVVDAIERGETEGVIASLAVVEILSGPARASDAIAFERTADAIAGLALTVVDLDLELAADAAWLHGALGGTAADAIHLATARRAGATAFVTNDHRLRSIPRLEIVYLDAIA